MQYATAAVPIFTTCQEKNIVTEMSPSWQHIKLKFLNKQCYEETTASFV